MFTKLRLKIARLFLPKGWTMETTNHLKSNIRLTEYMACLATYTLIQRFMDKRYGNDWRDELYQTVAKEIDKCKTSINQLNEE